MVRRPHLVAAAVTAGIALAAAVGIADATTGPNGTTVPRVLVAKSIGTPFTGRFTITHIEKRAKIAGGQVAIAYTITKTPYLFGTFQLATYDVDGRQTNFVANLYPFEYTGGKLRAKILSPGSHENLGSMTFDPSSDPKTLKGTLTFQGGTYDVAYKRTNPDAPITGSTGTPGDASATQTGGGASPTTPAMAPADTGSTGEPTPAQDGLGAKDTDYDSRYALRPSDVDPGASAGLYAPVVRVAAALASGDPDSGSLTLSAKPVKQGAPLVPTGVMSLHRPDSIDVVYLTDFKWAPGTTRRTAIVRSGSTDGPRVGTFDGTIEKGVVSGTLSVGKQKNAVSFEKSAG